MKRKIHKLSRSVLQNLINRDLLILGKNAIKELVPKYHKDIDLVVVPNKSNSLKINKIVEVCRKYGVDLIFSSETIKKIEDMQVDSSGVVAILKKKIFRFYSLNEALSMVSKLDYCTLVSFYNIDYEHNIGSMIRTCVGMGVDFLLVPNGQQKVFSSTVTKVSMGYNYLIPIVQENFLLAIEKIKQHGFAVIGLDMGGENIMDVMYNPKTCFIVGNEGKGLSDTVLKKCDRVVSIPMNNDVESLNVSVSLGIALYDRKLKENETK